MAALFALPLAGCTTTQHEAQRIQLESARQRAALQPTRVTLANPVVAPTAVDTVTAAGRTAFVVTVENSGARAETDLPISVGYERVGGRRVYVNDGTDLEYFQAHLPAIAAHHSLTWVYTATVSLPEGSRPFAMVGRRRSVPARLTETGVRIIARFGLTAGDRKLMVHLYNPTSVPQYQLQLYAYARKGGRYVAAGTATVAALDAGARRRVRVDLVGGPVSALHLVAVPTILQ